MGIIGLGDWIGKQMLHGKESRMRTRFLKIIQERGVEIDKELQRMKKDHAIKDKKKQPIMMNAKGEETTDQKEGISFKMKDNEKFQKEFVEYMKEEIVMDVTPANREAVYLVRDMILKTKEEFGGRMGEMYDEWANSFESISEEKSKEEELRLQN